MLELGIICNIEEINNVISSLKAYLQSNKEVKEVKNLTKQETMNNSSFMSNS